MLRVGVGVELGEDDLALARGGGLLEDRRRAARHGPHHSAQKSTTTGIVARALDDLAARSPASVTSMTVMRFEDTNSCRWTSPSRTRARALPVVLLHGLTATHRYVVMGSQRARALRAPRDRLRRARPRRSDPAPAPDAYGYDGPRGRPARACWTSAGSSARCSPAPRWARTRCCASRSSSPSASAALVVITPAYDPVDSDDAERLARWDALADGPAQRRRRGLRRGLRRPRRARGAGATRC